MTTVKSGPVLKAYVDVSELADRGVPIIRVALCFELNEWIEFEGVQLSGSGFLLPTPLRCNCTVSDISARHWEHAKYEIEFASSYSREGVFYANSMRQVQDPLPGVSGGFDAV
jgi:hypothetical protein